MLIILFIFLSNIVKAEIEFNGDFLDLSNECEYLLSDKPLTDIEVLYSNKLIFEKTSTKIISVNSNQEIWFRFKILNSSKQQKIFLGTQFFYYFPIMTSIKAYVIIKNHKNPDRYYLSKSINMPGTDKNFFDFGSIVNFNKLEHIEFFIKMSFKGAHTKHLIKPNLYINGIFKQMLIDHNSYFYIFLCELFIFMGIFICLYFFFSFKKKYYFNYSIYLSLYLLHLNLVINNKIKSFLFTLINNDYFKLITIFSYYVSSIFFMLFLLDFLKNNVFLSNESNKNYFIYKNKKLLAIFLIIIIGALFNISNAFNFSDFSLLDKIFAYLELFSMLLIYIFLIITIIRMKRPYFYLYLLAWSFYFVNLFFIKRLLTLDITKYNERFFELVDLLPDAILLLAIILDRFYKLSVEKLTNKKTDNLVLSLGSSPHFSEIFKNVLIDLKTIIPYESSYLFRKDIGYELISQNPDKVVLSDELKNKIIYFIKKDLREKSRVVFDVEEINKTIFIIRLTFSNSTLGYIVLFSSIDNNYRNLEGSFLMEVLNEFSKKIGFILEHYNKSKVNFDNLQLNEIYENMRLFHGTFAHEMKIPLISLKNCVLSLNNEKYPIAEEKMYSYMESINEAVDYCFSYLEDTLSIMGIENKKIFKLSSIEDALKDLYKICDFAEIEVDRTIEDPNIDLYAPEKSVKNVVSMIFKNAVESLENMNIKKKLIRLKIFVKKGILNIIISDSGKGMNDDVKRNLFKRYTEGKMIGSGQGLLLCKSIVERLGGNIKIISISGIYTQVTFTMDIVSKEDISVEKN
jgi:signal transduction histidine kinase